ncbi:hypothetical protein [Nitrosomonas communis]|uniref:Uncharacterized protein n=1 Tax=Nitrosomonas communis TaxID=44574 RepID=A0A1I4TTB7_9PROT|nr:hypothetical protein [Nitrosomonas communis]SFM79949.1 hypothetical protein SAMN05421863_105423 [Nitrosomonas communis]
MRQGEADKVSFDLEMELDDPAIYAIPSNVQNNVLPHHEILLSIV